MKFTLYGDERKYITWSDGKVTGDDASVAVLQGTARGMEGHPVGPRAGPYTETDHLSNPLSTYFLVDRFVFRIERHEGDVIPCPPEVVGS